jgi:hypothetical protein
VALGDFFRNLRAFALLKEGVHHLKRIADSLEEQNLAKGGPRGLSFHTLYEDKNSPEEPDLQFPSDEYFAELEAREAKKRLDMGPEAELSDEDVEDLFH